MQSAELIQRYRSGERDFRGIVLRGGNLIEANLRGAHFDEADFTGARFQNADLSHARLDRAMLEFKGVALIFRRPCCGRPRSRLPD